MRIQNAVRGRFCGVKNKRTNERVYVRLNEHIDLDQLNKTSLLAIIAVLFPFVQLLLLLLFLMMLLLYIVCMQHKSMYANTFL